MDLFEWTGVDKFGRSRVYQSWGPASETEAANLAHFREAYPNLTITSFTRKEPGDAKPPTGIVERHTFGRGILERVRKELGLDVREITDSLNNRGLSLLTYAKKSLHGNRRDAEEYGVELQRQFEREVDAARERAALPEKPAAFGMGRSLSSGHALRRK